MLGISSALVCACAVLVNSIHTTDARDTGRSYEVNPSPYGQPTNIDGAQGFLYYYYPGPYYDEPEKESSVFYSAPVKFMGLVTLPILALLGLSYLPISFGTARSFDNAPSFAKDMNEAKTRVEQLYQAAIGSEECLRRIVCDIGTLNSNAKSAHKKILAVILDLVTPKSYHDFALFYKYGLMEGQCEKFVCDINQANNISNEKI